MKLGSFEIPEKRLVPDELADIKKIYDSVKSDEISSKDLSIMLGYKHPTATSFYMRLNSMVSYGLLEGRGTFRVSALGKDLAYPENEIHEKNMKNKAILNVSLWKELYQKYQKLLPTDSFWVNLKNITGIEPQEAQIVEKQIKKWYVEDISNVSEDLLNPFESKDLSLKETNTKQMAQQLSPSVDPNSFGRLTIKGIGDIDLTDDDTITLAESALGILRKKLPLKPKEIQKEE
jgi:hypothetical protein